MNPVISEPDADHEAMLEKILTHSDQISGLLYQEMNDSL